MDALKTRRGNDAPCARDDLPGEVNFKVYCEKCKHLFEGECCPNCRRSRVRQARPDDPCFLTEKGAPWNGMLADVLRQNDIPFLTDGRMGAGLAARVGTMLESNRFYVRQDDLERAERIVDELFGEASPR